MSQRTNVPFFTVLFRKLGIHTTLAQNEWNEILRSVDGISLIWPFAQTLMRLIYNSMHKLDITNAGNGCFLHDKNFSPSANPQRTNTRAASLTCPRQSTGQILRSRTIPPPSWCPSVRRRRPPAGSPARPPPRWAGPACSNCSCSSSSGPLPPALHHSSPRERVNINKEKKKKKEKNTPQVDVSSSTLTAQWWCRPWLRSARCSLDHWAASSGLMCVDRGGGGKLRSLSHSLSL